MSSTIPLKSTCLCKSHTFTTPIRPSQLPLQASLCHCTSCRHMTGALYSSSATWPGPTPSLSKLRSYNISNRIQLYFCATCSTPMFFKFAQWNMLNVFTGTLENLDIELVRVKEHIFVGDTGDGGASCWLKHVNGDGGSVPRYVGWDGGDELDEIWPPKEQMTGWEKRVGGDEVGIRCRCRGVEMKMLRGNYDGVKKEDLNWAVDPVTYKRIALFCGCDSCRLSFGVDVIHWSFVELAYFAFMEDKAGGKCFPKNVKELKDLVDGKDHAVGTLAYYTSSPGVQRYFCSVCSACVFFAVEDRPDMVDLAVGVIDAPDGARAEGFLSWSFGGPIGHPDDTKGGWREGFGKRVTSEAEKWRIERGYPKNWRRVAREEAAARN